MQLMDCEKRLPPASTPSTVGWECELQVLAESADLGQPLNQPVKRESARNPKQHQGDTLSNMASAKLQGEHMNNVQAPHTRRHIQQQHHAKHPQHPFTSQLLSLTFTQR